MCPDADTLAHAAEVSVDVDIVGALRVDVGEHIRRLSSLPSPLPPLSCVQPLDVDEDESDDEEGDDRGGNRLMMLMQLLRSGQVLFQ